MSVKDDIARLVDRPVVAPRLDPAVDPSAKRAQTGLTVKSRTGGIKSPLTETDADNRTYHEPETGPYPHYITSSDGIFVIEYLPIATMTMSDGDGNVVMIEFDEPTPPA